MNEIKPVPHDLYWIQTPNRRVILATYYEGHAQHYFVQVSGYGKYTYKYQPKSFGADYPLATIVKELEEPPEPVLEPGWYWMRYTAGKAEAKVIKINRCREGFYETPIGGLNKKVWEVGPRVEPPAGWE